MNTMQNLINILDKSSKTMEKLSKTRERSINSANDKF